MTISTTVVTPPAGTSVPWTAALITVDNVRSTERVQFFLTTAAGVANGAIRGDYTMDPTSGALTVRDTVFTQANGSAIATYYGNEATNPVLTSIPGFVPANPGYAYTQYIYAAPNNLVQVIAQDASGRIFVGTGTGVV